MYYEQQRIKKFNGKLNKLVPRLINGIPDDAFKICSYCAEIYPIYEVKLEAEYKPKATTVKHPFESSTKVVALGKKRKYKHTKHGRAIDNDQQIPPLAGKPDRELPTDPMSILSLY
jgi:hypothetical protein